ncbi:3518_t:CDS:2 [Ambispora gerdemannii]|uniref:3518_t:CDS:1 n=1 Tax=Ambispora gerdemannii TaxID=144530 RepID=A0A9N9BG61_9GLOM|nr:3518_t:CDS:2 [Ambispora gerdemannii]
MKTINLLWCFLTILFLCILDIKSDQIYIISPTTYQQFAIGSTIPITIKIQYEGLALLENVTLQTLDADTRKIVDDDFYNTNRQDFEEDRAFNTTLFLDPKFYVPKGHQLNNNDLATGIYTIHAIGDCTYTTDNKKQHVQIFKDVDFMIVNTLSRDIVTLMPGPIISAAGTSAAANLSPHRRRWTRNRSRSLFKH